MYVVAGFSSSRMNPGLGLSTAVKTTSPSTEHESVYESKIPVPTSGDCHIRLTATPATEARKLTGGPLGAVYKAKQTGDSQS